MLQHKCFRYVGGDPLAKKFDKGVSITCSLMITDYHHFHSPVSGKIVAENQLDGLYLVLRDLLLFTPDSVAGTL